MPNKLESLLNEKPYLLLDGAMGTMLMQNGLASGDPPEEWNVTRPEAIQAVHRGFIKAGADIILTNSFGGSAYRLKLHQFQDRVSEFNEAAARNARVAAAEVARPVLVAGSIGPSGELFEPMGEMTFEDAVNTFAAQADALVAGGADLLWIETMSDLKEVEAAVTGIKQVSNTPICATLTFDTKGHTMMGVSPVEALDAMSGWGLAAIGANCGNGPDEIEAVVHTMHQHDPSILLIAKSNAGIPSFINGEMSYDGTPEVMADYAARVRALGARLVGGCCGNTPEHLRAMASALDAPVLEHIVAKTAEAPAAARGRARRRRS